MKEITIKLAKENLKVWIKRRIGTSFKKKKSRQIKETKVSILSKKTKKKNSTRISTKKIITPCMI